MYKLVKSITTGQINSVVKEESNLRICIPMIEGNTDYQAYLKWLEEGNTPELADEING